MIGVNELIKCLL